MDPHSRPPRRAHRIAPFVVLIGLVVYAVVMFAMLTAPTSAKAAGRPAAIDTSDSTPWASPTMPTRCTPSQIASGDVVSCAISQYTDPIVRGWGTPPMP